VLTLHDLRRSSETGAKFVHWLALVEQYSEATAHALRAARVTVVDADTIRIEPPPAYVDLFAPDTAIRCWLERIARQVGARLEA